MIIIIEGPDLSGKSFAIEQIGKFFNNGYTIKNNYKPRTVDDNKIYTVYWNMLRMITHEKGSHRIVILDRFYPSQAVYSYMRGSDEMEHEEINTLDKFCNDINVKYIYLDTDLKDLEKRYQERGDEHIKMGDLKLLKKRYDKFFKKTRLKKIAINTLEEGWLNKIKEFVEEKE